MFIYTIIFYNLRSRHFSLKRTPPINNYSSRPTVVTKPKKITLKFISDSKRTRIRNRLHPSCREVRSSGSLKPAGRVTTALVEDQNETGSNISDLPFTRLLQENEGKFEINKATVSSQNFSEDLQNRMGAGMTKTDRGSIVEYSEDGGDIARRPINNNTENEWPKKKNRRLSWRFEEILEKLGKDADTFQEKPRQEAMVKQVQLLTTQNESWQNKYLSLQKEVSKLKSAQATQVDENKEISSKLERVQVVLKEKEKELQGLRQVYDDKCDCIAEDLENTKLEYKNYVTAKEAELKNMEARYQKILEEKEDASSKRMETACVPSSRDETDLLPNCNKDQILGINPRGRGRKKKIIARKLETVTQALDSEKKRIEALLKVIQNRDAEIDILRQEVPKLAEKIKALNQSRAADKKKFALDKKAAANNHELDAAKMKSMHNDALFKLQASLDQSNQTVAKLRDENKGLEQKLSEFKRLAVEANARAEKFQFRQSQNQPEIVIERQRLKQNLAEKEANLAELATRLEAKEKEVERLDSDLGLNSILISSLNSQIASLKKKQEELEMTIKTIMRLDGGGGGHQKKIGKQ